MSGAEQLYRKTTAKTDQFYITAHISHKVPCKLISTQRGKISKCRCERHATSIGNTRSKPKHILFRNTRIDKSLGKIVSKMFKTSHPCKITCKSHYLVVRLGEIMKNGTERTSLPKK